jgi:hypothetical protein
MTKNAPANMLRSRKLISKDLRIESTVLRSNEAVEKPFGALKPRFRGSALTPPGYAIVQYRAFYVVHFLRFLPNFWFGGFSTASTFALTGRGARSDPKVRVERGVRWWIISF